MNSALPLLAAVLLLTGCLGQLFESEEKPAQLPKISLSERSSPHLKATTSCSGLEGELRDHLKGEMRAQLLQYKDRWYPYDMVMESTDTVPTGANEISSDSSTQKSGFSQTNNQEADVDEADFVKTDGDYIYLLDGSRLVVLETASPGGLAEYGNLELGGQPQSLLIYPDGALVFSYLYAEKREGEVTLNTEGLDSLYADYRYYTRISQISLIDKAQPQLEREFFIEGNLVAARMIDHYAYWVSERYIQPRNLHYYPNYGAQSQQQWEGEIARTIEANEAIIDEMVLSDFIPASHIEQESDITSLALLKSDCTNVQAAEDSASRSFVSIFSLDLSSTINQPSSSHILSQHAQVYASQNILLLAEPAQDWWWYWDNETYDEATNIHRFSLSNGSVNYQESGRVDGTVLNQFSLSEYRDELGNSTIRVATTTGNWNRWWLDTFSEPDNHIYILAGEDSLDVIGHLDGIGTGERIWSARFVDEMAYLVTFRNIDPLWTIDLSDPTAPIILGELEVPGVSTYIHPLDGELLTIGFGGDGSGLDWSTQLNLFNVANPITPSLSSQLSLAPNGEMDDGWAWGWSEATYEHKAFQYWYPRKLLAVPVSSYRYQEIAHNQWSYQYQSLLKLVSVSNGELSHHGQIDHSEFYNREGDYWGDRDVRRSIFNGDHLYVISDRGASVHALNNPEVILESVELKGTSYSYCCDIALAD